jgi:hypothetical protein
MVDTLIIKENLTDKNKEKLIQILQKNISPDDEIMIISNEEKDMNKIANNMQFNYILGNLMEINEELLEKYLKEQFTNDLKQFLEQKGYNLTKAPIFKVHKKNFDLINEEKLSIGFLNFMEINNKRSFLGPDIIKEFEIFFFEKLKLIFDINYNIMEKTNLSQLSDIIKEIAEEKEEIDNNIELSL